MKKLSLILLLAVLTVAMNAQINTKHFFGTITASDLSVVKALKGGNLSTSLFLRFAVAETAWEVPLFKGGGGQFFSSTGVGLSLAVYGLKDNIAVEKFSTNVLLFVPNIDNDLNGLSTALTIGVPIPKLNLPNINAGIRYDWKAKIAYLQTSITLEF
jgi:hypothetical protein